MNLQRRNAVTPFILTPSFRWRLNEPISTRELIAFILWCFITLNSLLDPIKTLYGYYWSKDGSKHNSVWALTVSNIFENQTSKVCNLSGPFSNCYYELPVYGTGSLAGSTCRSYYPIDKGVSQHIGNFFGNCTLPSGQQLFFPDNSNYATTQWSIQTSSTRWHCLSWLGEGESFPCDSHTTANGHVINYRVSHTETSKWCKEFGAYYILNISANHQQLLIANMTDPTIPSFTSLSLDYNSPVLNLYDISNCSLHLHVGGTPAHITTTAWYGDTIAPWTARTTSSAKSNVITAIENGFRVDTYSFQEGDITLVRSSIKDFFRCMIEFIIIYYRFSSIYYPMWLVYQRQNKPILKWALYNHRGLVIHKRERRNIFILFLLTLETIMSTEDIVMYCQRVVYTDASSYFTLMLNYMSITRIIWPSSFVLLFISKCLQLVFGPSYAISLSEDLFLLGAPVIWLYIPTYVTTQGMGLMQGYRWTGKYIHHYANSVYNVYTKQYSVLDLYTQLFGYFTIISAVFTVAIGILWQRFTSAQGIIPYLFSKNDIDDIRHFCLESKSSLEQVLLECSSHLPRQTISQIVAVKHPGSNLCEAMNLASEGLVCLVYGSYTTLAWVEWGVAFPICNEVGHVACVQGHISAYNSKVSIDILTIPSHPVFTHIASFRNFISLLIWLFLSVNSFLDPAKTFYGYYTYTDSDNQPAVWELTVVNNYNNVSSKVCSTDGNFLDCYYELPVYGSGTLANAVCRSYYPVDKGAAQHIGTFFGNCTLPNGNRVDYPNNVYATSQWSLMVSSQDKACITSMGEGDSFPCDSYMTMEGRVMYFRVSRSVASTWCKELGGYYILNKNTNKQEVLVANVSNPSKPTFTSIPLTHNTTVYNVYNTLGCSADLTVGGAAGHISTSAWYGSTVGLWMAHTTSSPKDNAITFKDDMVNVVTMSSHDGNVTQIRTFYKDAVRCFLFFVVIYYRLASIYYPIWLVYARQGKSFLNWVSKRHMGLVLHKRERRSLPVLFLLTIEAVVSTEDIIMYCQQVVYSYPTLWNLVFKYMSITRIIWPSSFILLVISRLVQMIFGPKYAFALSEDLFLLGAPVIWFYMPAYVTVRGMALFQGYRWTGDIVHHYGNTIWNVYSAQENVLYLYYNLFGSFTYISCLTTIGIGCLWQTLTHTSSIMSVFLSSNIFYRVKDDVEGPKNTIEKVSTEQFPPEIIFQIIKAKWPKSKVCEAMNLASEGFVCLVYGEYQVLGTTEWGLVYPIVNESGHVAIIDGCQVAYNVTVTLETLASITSHPKVLVVQLLPDVKILVEEDLEGRRVDAHGHFEFVLKRGAKAMKQLYEYFSSALSTLRFVIWCVLNLNSIFDPLKTFYGYYLSTDSNYATVIWQLTVNNNFNNVSSSECKHEGPYLDCYFELPVYGTGSLAGSTCRSYYPIDKGETQHIGSFFGNCSWPNGTHIYLPDELHYATTQWSAQVSSVNRDCLSMLGEGDSFPCDSYTTQNGRILNYRLSISETTKWCKEFGGYYINNLTSNTQQVLIANVSNPSHPSFTSLVLDVNTPTFNLHDIIGCSADLRIGAISTTITTTAWYGNTAGPWSAKRTLAAQGNTLVKNNTLYNVQTRHYTEGDITLVRLMYKDAIRIILLLTVIVYRISSIYIPIGLVYYRYRVKFINWIWHHHVGLVIHKRERRNLFILFILSLEAIISTEDIVMYCQHTVYTDSSAYGTLLLNYMSITRIIWPCAFVLLHEFALSENIFVLSAPVVWGYVPIYVTNRGMSIFQGYRWTGQYIRHYTNSIYNVYSNELNCFILYRQLFGVFTIISPILTILFSTIWRATTHTSGILAYLLSSPSQTCIVMEINKDSTTLCEVLQQSTYGLVPDVAKQMTRAKVSGVCEAANLAADGLVGLIYGNYLVVGFMEWGIVYPLENELGHVAIVEGSHVSYNHRITVEKLVEIASVPSIVGIPELI
ncbi:hypothetical protein THRCLA_20788 [Thraustotheca clavata]|uniref:Uncharacterized protein n=1 Tax=Thraustotheca clavata TaxID=74557 RepID=A0A1W0A3R1_9STRA|nr:hypothetical protein THRCLA_20788 [Thraustotheca clavata]